MTQLDDLRERVADACRVLGSLNLTKDTFGHVSARLPGTNRIVIRARGPKELGVKYTTAEQVIEIDADGKAIDAPPGLQAPAEVLIHTELYRKRPDVFGVVHVHPPKVVALTICRKPLRPLFAGYDPPGLSLVLDGIPTYERAITITTQQLADDFVSAMGDSHVCLMRGHGLTTANRSVEEAAMNAITLTDLASMNFDCALLGGAEDISAEDIAHYRERWKKTRPTDGGPGQASATKLATWRHYITLAKEAS